MERITADELAILAHYCAHPELRLILERCAFTVREMDKDIAVYEAQIDQMQRQFRAICDGEEETR